MPKTLPKFWKDICNILDAHTPTKTNVLRGNLKPDVDKNLSKVIMKRSKFKDKANRT